MSVSLSSLIVLIVPVATRYNVVQVGICAFEREGGGFKTR
jgi:hypothetical protein